jgi:hypothetical protein
MLAACRELSPEAGARSPNLNHGAKVPNQDDQ